MTTEPSTRAGLWLRAVSIALVAVVFCVPPLVRATDHVGAGTTSPLKLRLNRGFNVPETKCRVTPPPAESASLLAADEVTPPRTMSGAPAFDPAIAPSPHHPSPEVLRGPPATRIL